MALSVSSSTSAPDAANWVDFYVKNRNDNGPIQALFSQNLLAMAQKTSSHLRDANALTETVVGSAHGNIMLVPGRTGFYNLLHDVFEAATDEGFALIFAQGNLEDCTIFKSIPRAAVVARLINETGLRSGTKSDCPSLEAMMGVESADAFAALPPETNDALKNSPNHFMLTPRFSS